VDVLIISGRLAREPELKKVIVEGKKRFVMDNCIFVNSSNQTKDSIPVNITAWDKNATYIAENFEKGEKVNIIGIERLHKVKIGDKAFGICSFTVIKIIDWKIYRAITGMLQAFISRMINCTDIIPENLLSAELMVECLEGTEKKIKKRAEEKDKKENIEEEIAKEKIEDINGTGVDSDNTCDDSENVTEDEVLNTGEIENENGDEIPNTAEAENDSGYECNGQLEDEEDEDEEWAHVR